MGSIGGYLGLGPTNVPSPHQGAIALDLGRHALELILCARRHRRLLAPRYTCEVLAPTIHAAGVEVVLYDLDKRLDPVLPAGPLAPTDALLYTNYFGLKHATVQNLAATVPHLILDNVQDFYGAIPHGVDAFVSCRKFFGVPDGSYLHCEAARDKVLAPADPIGRWAHLLVAADRGSEAGFPLYQEHECRLADAPVRGMSHLTAQVMNGIDHAQVMAARRHNRDRLHAALQDLNRLPIDPAAATIPMVYPFLSDDGPDLRERLQVARIYTARYWPGLLAPLTPSDGGHRFTDEVIFLPVDQRYGAEEMDRMIDEIVG
jgi:hypothetical protein